MPARYPSPQNISEVLEVLDDILAECNTRGNYLGIFAWVYRRTTAEIQKAIQDGRFANNQRMEIFDVRFARYYIDAYYAYVAGQPVSKSWEVAFLSANDRLSILQHLMMGMNAHINLDLGVTAAVLTPGDQIAEMEGDFMIVNDILEELVDEMQERMSQVSPLFWLVDRLGQNDDERFADFSMRKARTNAWNLACLLATMDETSRDAGIKTADAAVAAIGGTIKQPPGRWIRFLLDTAGRFERKFTW
jgi:Family of unknown function (DUF5995)